MPSWEDLVEQLSMVQLIAIVGIVVIRRSREHILVSITIITANIVMQNKCAPMLGVSILVGVEERRWNKRMRELND